MAVPGTNQGASRCEKVAERASTTLIDEQSSRRRANIPVNPRACVARSVNIPESQPEVASKCSAGHSAASETPMAIERAGLAPVCFNFGDRRTAAAEDYRLVWAVPRSPLP